MKKNYTHISRLLTASVMLFLVSALTLLGQTPTTFQYQAVLRNADGTINADANVNIMLELHQTTETGTVVYDETHSVTTSEFGMVNLEMGSETPGTFAAIDWSAGPYFVEVSVNGLSMGTSELLTVPYALYAVNGVPGPQGDQGIQGIQGIQGEPGLPGVIEANSVGSSHVIDNSLTVDDLAPNSVGSDEIAAGVVGTSEVADNSLTAADLATNSVGAAEIATGAVGASEIADGTVGALEIGTGAVGSIEIATGTILDVDVNANAEIAATKILGMPGVEYNNTQVLYTWPTGDLGWHTFSTITMTIPRSGYVLLTHAGLVRAYGGDRILQIGVGTTATTFNSYTYVGINDPSVEDISIPYSVTGIIPVTAGTYTFYGIAHGIDVSGTIFVNKQSLIGVFIPLRY